MFPDTLHRGVYLHRPLEPGVYVVVARRIGFHAITDTIRLERGQIDSATYHAAVDPTCLTSADRGL